MHFVADEGLDTPIVELLRNNSYEIFYIKEEHPGFADEDVLKIANQRNSVLITTDIDFGELVYRLKQIHNGIILVRLSGMKPAVKAKIVTDAIKEHEKELQGSFTVINKTHVKIRK